jgi:peptide/nickel transport system permease protein
MGRLTPALIKRLFQGLFVAWGVSTVCFSMMVALPGDLALRVALARYGEDLPSSEVVAHVREKEKLDRPLAIQYFQWLMHTLKCDLGGSLVSGRPVAAELWFHFRKTLVLAGTALGISLVLAVPWGVMAGLRPGGRFDRFSTGLSSALVSIPPFVLGALLILGLAIHCRLFPAAGFTRPEHLALPALTLALGLAAVSNRVIRTSVAEVGESFFITFAKIKGLPARRIVLGHGVRNAATPVVTFIGLQLAHLLDGVVVVENLFDWPGLGHLILDSIFSRDLPMIQGAALLIGGVYVLVNLAADLVCRWLDPRQGLKGETL